MDSFESRMNSRFLAESAKGMLWEPRVIESGRGTVEGFKEDEKGKRRASVLSSFSLSWFSVISGWVACTKQKILKIMAQNETFFYLFYNILSALIKLSRLTGQLKNNISIHVSLYGSVWFHTAGHAPFITSYYCIMTSAMGFEGWKRLERTNAFLHTHTHTHTNRNTHTNRYIHTQILRNTPMLPAHKI